MGCDPAFGIKYLPQETELAAIRDIGNTRCRRLCDVFIACLMIALFLPLMAVAALAIKADGGGPALNRQVRICRSGRWVQTFGFRTAATPGRGIIQVHRFLRCTRIDTLPQTINVLRGDLTFIGNDRPGFLT
jgi:lipopolysaccharide/colanic/teichoic acid biosynthesis glycosyltransferase